MITAHKNHFFIVSHKCAVYFRFNFVPRLINDFSFFFVVALQRVFNSIYVSLWCHWSVSRYQFRYCNWTEAERKLIYSLQLLILISLSILFMLCHGPLHFEISVIVSSLTMVSGKKINTELPRHVVVVYDAVRRLMKLMEKSFDGRKTQRIHVHRYCPQPFCVLNGNGTCKSKQRRQ